jgi:GNAT superfamily N-acetyltransferase
MGRRLERLTPDTLADLPAEVRADLTWECDPVDAARVHGAEAEEHKRDWLSGVLLEWGSCGRVAYHDDQPAGFIVYAPPSSLPGTGSYPTAPISDDAVQLATAAVFAGHQGHGLGRTLVQVMARDLVRRGGVRAVEAVARTGPATGSPGSGDCAPVPAEFLQRVGFTTVRSHPRHPRLRLDLRSLVSWLDEVGTAWEWLRDVVRPRGRPVPASREAGLTDGQT